MKGPSRVEAPPPRPPWALLLPLALAVLGYARVLHGEFQFDDLTSVEENRAVKVPVSEEIHASYYYSSQAPNPLSYYHDNLDLLKAVHRYDVLRSARSMENHSLECRTPFADQNLVRFVMSIDPRRKMFQFLWKTAKNFV